MIGAFLADTSHILDEERISGEALDRCFLMEFLK